MSIYEFGGKGSDWTLSEQTCDGVQRRNQQQHDNSKVDIQPESLVDKNCAREHVRLSGGRSRKHIHSIDNVKYWNKDEI